MAQTIKLKRSSVAGNVPGASDLSLGEIAVNTADGAVYIKKGNNDIVAVADNDILHIDTTNSRIGIGTTSPGKPLDVLGDIRSIVGSSNQHQLRATQVISYGTDAILNAQSTGDDVRLNTQNTTRRIATAEGNVGIGDDSPGFKLAIRTPAIPSGSTYSWPLDLSRPNTDNRGLTFGVGTSGGPHAIAAHNGDIGIGQTYGTDSNGLPQFYETLSIVHDGTASQGKVGIGTTSPAQLLDVDGTARFGTSTYRLTLQGNSSGGSFKIGTTSNDDSLANFGAFSSSFVLDTTQTNGFVFRLTGAEKMRLTQGGYLGIGDTNPSFPLDVNNTSARVRFKATTGHSNLELSSIAGRDYLVRR